MKFKSCIGFRLATVFGYSYRMRTDLLVNNFVFTAIKKNKLTSAADINLGAIVTKTNGMATQRIHIAGTMIKSLLTNS